MRIGKETGFIIRKPKKVRAIDFLKMLLFDPMQYDCPSLHQHAFGLDTTDCAKISKEGLSKRFNSAAVLFVQRIFESYMLDCIKHEHIPTGLDKKFKSIRILDSTEFKVSDSLASVFPGYSSAGALACAAIQFEYDILGKQVHSLTLGSANQSDKTYADQTMDNIAEGDLLLRDLGYYSVSSYEKIESRKAFYISRLKSQVKIYEQVNGEYKALEVSVLIKRIRKGKKGFIDQTVYIGAREKKQVRILAWLLPEDAQKNRLSKKKGKKGKVNRDDVLWSMLNVFVTNVTPEDLAIEQIYEMYKIRWQIELMFKTWKSVLKLNSVRKMKSDRLKCYLYAKLLWVLLCWDITAEAEVAVWSKKKKLVSIYKCYALLKSMAAELKNILFNVAQQLKEWLLKMQDYFSVYGLKENKKGRKNIIEILDYH